MKKSLFVALATAGMALFAADAALAHGCHRSCERGPAGWHRHVGYSCARVACSPAAHYYGKSWHKKPQCVTKCKGIGPFKSCKTRCG